MRVCRQIDAEGTGYLEHAMEEMNFSARAHDRILKVARTLCDLAGSESIRLTTSSKPSSSARWIASYSPEFAFVAIAGYGST